MTDRARAPRHAFTLVELLVVIAIIVLLIVLALPAFSSMVYSQQSSAAESRLASAVAAARDAAVRSGTGQDAAAVFFFEPGGNTTVIACLKVGTLLDRVGGNDVLRDVFVPLDTVEPIELPRGWMVRAYAPQSALGVEEWYDAGGGPLRYPATGPAWVFPETGFYDLSAADAGRDRQSFMIRFEGGTGSVLAGVPDPVLVVSPRPSDAQRPTSTNLEWRRPDRASDLRRWAVRILTDRRNLTDQERRAIIGGQSSDVVLARGTTMIALYDERRMAAALGVRTDPISGSLYEIDPGEFDAGRQGVVPRFVTGIPGNAASMSRWIEGYANPTAADATRADNPEARIFTIDRVLGVLRPVQVQLTPVGGIAAGGNP
ncbi:MAG: prepilin-type N-terminal cleavage/methylation domain-containing protein [Phycisphaeraceae bacterium]|nr:prepilin-type N-terminal cleavage/methylation domain-containing protein [Phycisphaeraceae bacterium]